MPVLTTAEPLGRFRRATRRLPGDQSPVWFMRQAGRTLPEYRKLRERWTLLEMCADAAPSRGSGRTIGSPRPGRRTPF